MNVIELADEGKVNMMCYSPHEGSIPGQITGEVNNDTKLTNFLFGTTLEQKVKLL